MSSVVISGDSSGTISLTVPSVAGTNTATLPAATGTVMVSGNMPTFGYYQSVAQTVATTTGTKVTFTGQEWDTTGGMYASSRFTPTIAGYYQINCGITMATSNSSIALYIYKNGNLYKRIASTGTATVSVASGGSLIYCNGSTDYVEIYCYLTVGQNLYNAVDGTWFNGALVRTA